MTRDRKSSPASLATARRRGRQKRPPESARILIVDDEPPVAELIRDHLLRRGYTVDLAFSADEALTAIRQIRRDLVLLDSAMPQIDGVETLGRIRALDATVAVIIVSGSSEGSGERETAALGPLGRVMKPIDFADLDRATSVALTCQGARTGRRPARPAGLA